MNSTRNISIEALYIEITNVCNYECVYCYNDSGNFNHTFVKTEAVYDIIKKLVPAGLTRVTYSGGEPLLHPQLRELILFAQSMHLQQFLITNGSFLTPDWCQFIYQTDVNIQLTLDGCTAEIHDAVRGEGTYKKTLAAIQLITEYQLLKKLILRCNLSFHNYRFVPSYIDFASKMGIDNLQFSLLTCSGRGKKITRLDKVKDRTIVDEIKKVIEERKSCFEILILLNQEINIACPLLKENESKHFRINYYGDIFPCQALSDNRFLLGNIYDEHFSLETLETNFRKCVEMIKKRKYANLKCNSCAYHTLCQGGCIDDNLVFSSEGTLSACCSMRKKICRTIMREL